MSDYKNSLFEVEPTLVDNIFDIAFPDSIKKMISTNIYLATRATKEIRDMFLETPRAARRVAGIILPTYIDKYLISAINNLDINPLKIKTVERKGAGGSSYTEYISNNCKFHIKKTARPSLPKEAYHRKTNAESNKIFLNYGPNYIPEDINLPFAIVIFGHKDLDLKYIKIGFPTWDYTGWQNGKLIEISNYISTDEADRIEKKIPMMKEQLKVDFEKIEKEYRLTAK